MTLFEISDIIKNEIIVRNNHNIKWLLTDSRNLSFPAETLFFALKTERNDGHCYVVDLYKKGVRCFVISDLRGDFQELEDAEFLLVKNTLTALQQVAAYQRNRFNIPIIGITGSNGKTIVKEWLYQLLHSDLCIVRSPRSYNSQIGVPLSVWGLNEKTQLGIFEAGISKSYEMNKLQRIIRPTIGVFTNIGTAHQEGFISMQEKCLEKLKLFEQSEILIYSSDYQTITDCIKNNNLQTKIFTFGKNDNDDLQIISICNENEHSNIKLKYNNSFFEIKIPFTDNASLENALQCCCVMLILNYDFEIIAKRMLELESVAMRLELKHGIGNSLIINDSYNSDYNSLEIALDFLLHQATVKNLERVVVLSDILQSGQSDAELYENVAKLLKNKNIQYLIGIGTEISKHIKSFDIIQGAFFENTSDFMYGLSHDDSIKDLIFNRLKNSIILLKGSRQFHFEDISAALEMVAHETVLEINLNAIVDNFNYFRSELSSETKIVCMVKAFAYGSGYVEVARTLQHHRADYLAVAVSDEGAELRKEGITMPIIVMNPEKHALSAMFDNSLEPEIYNFNILENIISAAEKLGINDYPVHIKIDSGMHRLGFAPQDIPLLIQTIKNQTQVKIRSVFSHLAAADDAQFDDFTIEQVSTFYGVFQEIMSSFQHEILIHILNSAGIERFTAFEFNMVRLGIGLYGISSIADKKLSNVCTLKTVVLQIRNVKAGETVGYNRSGLLTSDSRIAVLPIGYADGYDRRLGNGVGEVFINGKRAKTVGNICMDLTMVDITHIDVNEEDTVEVFGENITISEVAQKSGTIPYEILTGISRRVKRIYFQE